MDKTAFANRRWDAAMVRFLTRQRRRGKPIRWIAEKLGVSLVRAVAEAINRGLVLRTAYRGRRTLAPGEPDLEPLGAPRDLPDDHLCHWITGHPTDAWRMCARPVQNQGPWCPHHHAQVYVQRAHPNLSVMAGLDPATQGQRTNALRAFASSRESLLQAAERISREAAKPRKDAEPRTLGGRVKPGHDDQGQDEVTS